MLEDRFWEAHNVEISFFKCWSKCVSVIGSWLSDM